MLSPEGLGQTQYAHGLVQSLTRIFRTQVHSQYEGCLKLQISFYVILKDSILERERLVL